MTSQDLPYLSFRRRNTENFERFDNLPSYNETFSVSHSVIEKSAIDCRFLFRKSKWGVLGETKNPAGIIYMDIDIQQPGDQRFKDVSITVSLDEEPDEVLGNSSRDPPSVPIQIYSFGPHVLRSSPEVISNVQTQQFTPEIRVGGPSGIGGIGHEAETTTTFERTPWLVRGSLQARKGSESTYSTVEWVFSPSPDTSHIQSHTFHTAFAFVHSGQPFFMRVEVGGAVKSASSNLKHLLRYPSNRFYQRINDNLVNVGEYNGARKSLDALAEGLPKTMEYENMKPTPIEIPDEQRAIVGEAAEEVAVDLDATLGGEAYSILKRQPSEQSSDVGSTQYSEEQPVVPELSPSQEELVQRESRILDEELDIAQLNEQRREMFQQDDTYSESSSIGIEYTDAFKVSLRRDDYPPEDRDRAMAQWRHGKSNYVIRAIAERHRLQKTELDTVKGYVGVFRGPGAPHLVGPVVFQIKPDSTPMGDVLLGDDFRKRVTDLEQWGTTSTQGDVAHQGQVKLETYSRRLAPTDSGYASGTQYISKQAEISEVHKEFDEIQAQAKGLYTAPTVYARSAGPDLDMGYISELASDIFTQIRALDSDKRALEHLSQVLPEILRAFALRVGFNAETQVHRDVSVFIHKYRIQIPDCFNDCRPDVEEDQNEDRIIPDTSANGDFTIGRFLEEPDSSYSPIGTPSESSFDEGADEILGDDANRHLYRDVVVNSPAYAWLVTTLQGELRLTRGTPDVMQHIRTDILNAFPLLHTVSHREPPRSYSIQYKLDWNPLSFIREQEYIETWEESIQSAITLTGTARDAQALTTREYLAQTWPATGNFIMQLVADMVRDQRSSCNLPDGTRVSARMDGENVVVEAIGIADSVVEVGQQFAWLGAALRSSPFDVGIAACQPSVYEKYDDSTTRANNDASATTNSEKISLEMGFAVSQPSTDSKGLFPGTCWHPMFKNPVMVTGYPILSRSQGGLGLELPLNMMGILNGSDRADLFDGKVFIKGFSTMLIATKLTQDLIIWHYFYNLNRERLSYFDHSLTNVDDIIKLNDLNNVRHVVGWCDDCKLFAGTLDSSYNIRRSKLPPPHAGCLLEKVSLSFSKFLSAGVSIAVGVKDVPPHLTRNGYVPKLRWISTTYAVLWDEADKRGWLVNGTSALLHLVRASLQHWSEDDFSDSFLFDSRKMIDSSKYKGNSASRVLANRHNRALVIYPSVGHRAEIGASATDF